MVQAPLAQIWPGSQALSQPPQWLELPDVLMQVPLQSLYGAEQGAMSSSHAVSSASKAAARIKTVFFMGTSRWSDQHITVHGAEMWVGDLPT